VTDSEHSALRLVCVGAATAAMATALASASFANTWLATGLAGAVAIALACFVDAPVLRKRLEPGLAPVALGLVTGLAMVAATFLLWPPLERAVPALGAALEHAYRPLHDWPGARSAIPVIALVVTAEELVWRGVLIEHLETRSNGARRIALAAAIYASAQLATGSILLVCVALACGAAWTALRLLTGSLLAPLLAHLVWGLAIFVVRPLA
jgi:membrane protease YdiL (CAAX protease family)